MPLLMPPMTIILPLGINVAVWWLRAKAMLPVTDQVLVVGLYSSLLALARCQRAPSKTGAARRPRIRSIRDPDKRTITRDMQEHVVAYRRGGGTEPLCLDRRSARCEPHPLPPRASPLPSR